MKVLILALFLLTACGDKGGSSGKPGGVNQNETVEVDGSNINGIYAADIGPVNYNLHFMKVGTAAIQREGDVFSALVKMKYGVRDTTQTQGIFTGTRCPRPSDDLNRDAYIDIREALVAIGHKIIPLDGNIDAQEMGKHDNPTGDAQYGRYFYQATASFERMFADLKLPDENSDDNLVKLGAEEGLTFPGKIVLIQGMTKKIKLPETVATLRGESMYESLPVACGVLKKVDKLPEEFNPEVPVL